MFAPSKPSAHPPIVFAWHPHGGNMDRSANQFRIQDYWPEAVVVYPQGLPTKTPVDRRGRMPGWQRIEGDSNDRDLKFFDVLYAKMSQEYSFDSKRVYSMGFSNGAFFTYLLWHARGDKLAGAAVAAASIDEANKPLTPLSIFVMAGKRDPLVPIADQEKAIAYERQIDGVAANAVPTARNGVDYFRGTGGDVAAYIANGTHSYPRAMSPSIVEFFKAHKRP